MIDTATNTTRKWITIGKFPGAIAITPNGKTAYVIAGGRLLPIQTATNTTLKAIKVGTDPRDIAITPNGKTAYVATSQLLGVSGTVISVNTATNKAEKAIRVPGGASFIAITPNGNTAYVVGDNTVIPVNTTTNKAEKASGVTSRLSRSSQGAAGPGRRASPGDPVQPRSWAMPPQHSHLLAQHQQPGVRRGRRTCRQRHPAGQAAEDQAEHPEGHQPAMLPVAPPPQQPNPQVSNLCPILEPHRPETARAPGSG